jgi:hypothetical protein
MTDEGIESVLAAQQLGRLGLEVKLDKGFQAGRYCVYVEYDGLADRIGFAAARRTAHDYCRLIKRSLEGLAGCELGAIQDGSETGDPTRNRDLEGTFLWFDIETGDGKFHDEVMREQFRAGLLRAGQVWDQTQAKRQAHVRQTRQERFRRRLADLLDGAAYAQLDGATKERLLGEISVLAFPPRGVER